MPPTVRVTGAVLPDTVLVFGSVEGGERYRLWRRRTDERDWTELAQSDFRLFSTPSTPSFSVLVATLPRVRIDDWIFGVSSVAADGSESPIASAVPGGAYAPLPRP